ncbi:hypothetical protein ACFLUT_02090 [Chloroflexota bacterium]
MTRTQFRHLSILVVLISAVALAGLVGCSPEEKPLPAPEGVTVVQGPYEPENDEYGDVLIVSWSAVNDDRVDGYVIYRAEQGLGPTPGEKTEYELQALTFALTFDDEEIHTTDKYPTMQYFYRIAVITPEGTVGPMSDEVDIEYAPLG